MSEQPTKVLILGYVWPEPDSSAAGSRMMQLISFFEKQGWEITFVSSAAESDHSFDLEARGVDRAAVEINSSDFDGFVRRLAPDVVLFDRFVVEEQFGWRVAEQCPEAVRILDTEDLHCLRRLRKKAVKQGRKYDHQALLTDDVAKREVASIYRCDLTLMISEYEMDLLKNLFKVDDFLLHYLPFLLEPIGNENIEHWPSYEDRQQFVTIGNFRHPPNADSVHFLKEKVWPLIRNMQPNAELHIYGAYPSPRITSLDHPEQGFHIEGRVEDAEELLRRARVCLSPLRFGAGLKGKLVEAMQCGTPSVTTRIGAEGISGELQWAGAVETEPEAIASAAVELYTNRSAWEKAQKRGIKIINGRFMKKDFEPELNNRLKQLSEHLEDHRHRNFTGSMLMHHTAASTRYMSKWIEEKNSV